MCKTSLELTFENFDQLRAELLSVVEENTTLMQEQDDLVQQVSALQLKHADLVQVSDSLTAQHQTVVSQVYHSVLQCTVLSQCVAACCSVLQWPYTD